MSEATSTLPLLELFVKASPVDPQDKGPCPISQKWFMVFYTMVEHQIVNLKVTPVDIKNPPEDYENLGISRHLPVVVIIEGVDPRTGEDLKGLVADNEDEIENVMLKFHCPGMQLGSSAFKVTEDLFRNFNSYLQTNNVANMLTNLRSLNEFISNRQNKYLQDDVLSFVDCVVMPKLQHVRVACSEFKNYEIPHDMTSLWTYMATMYENKAFTLSCPCDRDIVIQYSEKTNPRPKSSFLLRDNTVTDSIPDDVKVKIH